MSLVERAIDKLRREPSKVVPAKVGSTVQVPVLAFADGDADVAPVARVLIHRDALRESGYLPESEQDRQFADEYRQIKRPLIASVFGASGPEVPNTLRAIMMASALPGDGKTFTSINLALSMARERDLSVLLVDADVPKPHVSRIFGIEGEQGLLDALVDPGLDVESLVLPTDVKGLSLLSAGKSQEGATEWLASERMSDIVARLLAADPRRIVLFDSSPLLVSTESRALAGSVGQFVLVIRAGTTPRQAVGDALQLLGNERPVSIVLNQARAGLLSGSYGGYYRYGYGDSKE